MNVVFGVFVYLMVWKDLAYAPVPYALRVFAQVLCLAVGLLMLAKHVPQGLLGRYWPMLGYLTVIFVTAPAADFPWFVLLQCLSLASAVAFAIAYCEASGPAWHERYERSTRHIAFAYGIACSASLLFAVTMPSLVFGAMFVGVETGTEVRFHGLMSKSGMIAAAGGLLSGFALTSLKHRGLKLVLFAVGLTCVVLAQSRSFWVAALGAFFATGWLYLPRMRMVMLGLGAASAAGIAFLMIGGVGETDDGLVKFARLGSVTTLTGRTALWDSSLAGLEKSPWIGFGFTLGSTGLPFNSATNAWTTVRELRPTEFSRQTMHNGYVQALMDAGVIGFFFYVATVIVAIERVVRYDTERRFPALLYALTFLSIGNLGESVIYSGSVFHSLTFWVCAVFACYLPALSRHGVARSISRPLERDATTRFDNLMS